MILRFEQAGDGRSPRAASIQGGVEANVVGTTCLVCEVPEQRVVALWLFCLEGRNARANFAAEQFVGRAVGRLQLDAIITFQDRGELRRIHPRAGGIIDLAHFQIRASSVGCDERSGDLRSSEWFVLCIGQDRLHRNVVPEQTSVLIDEQDAATRISQETSLRSPANQLGVVGFEVAVLDGPQSPYLAAGLEHDSARAVKVSSQIDR